MNFNMGQAQCVDFGLSCLFDSVPKDNTGRVDVGALLNALDSQTELVDALEADGVPMTRVADLLRDSNTHKSRGHGLALSDFKALAEEASRPVPPKGSPSTTPAPPPPPAEEPTGEAAPAPLSGAEAQTRSGSGLESGDVSPEDGQNQGTTAVQAKEIVRESLEESTQAIAVGTPSAVVLRPIVELLFDVVDADGSRGITREEMTSAITKV